MPSPESHDAHDYAERIRARLPRRLQDAREACGLSMYALWQKRRVELRAQIEQMMKRNR